MSKSFTLNGHIIRSVMEESGQALYVASDICAALDYPDRSYALSKHCRALPIYRQAPTVSGSQRCRVLDDNDVHRLINACRLRDIIAVKQEFLDATHPWKKLKDDPEPVQQEIALPDPVAEVVAEPAAELVPTFMAKVGGVEQLCVDARVLHGFLGSGYVFANWFAKRQQKFGFVGGVDYEEVISSLGNNPPNPSQGGRPTKDYTLTIDMAKELSMVENNAQGRKARRYFIEMERRALAAAQTQAQAPTAAPIQVQNPEPQHLQPPTPLQDLLLIHKTMQGVAGIDQVALMARTLDAIEKATALPVHLMAKALPTVAPAPAPATVRQDAHLTATDIGALLGVTADHIQSLLHQTGMLAKDGSGWRLTDAGKRHGEMHTIPARSPRGHYVLWKPSVLSVLHDPRATH